MGVMRSVKSVILGTYVLPCCEVLCVLGVLRVLFGVLVCFLGVTCSECYDCYEC